MLLLHKSDPNVVVDLHTILKYSNKINEQLTQSSLKRVIMTIIKYCQFYSATNTDKAVHDNIMYAPVP